MYHIPEASGATVKKEHLRKEANFLRICEMDGYCAGMPPVECTALINAGIRRLHAQGGGTLVFPEGTYRVYTIRLLGSVNLLLEKGAVIAAARTDVDVHYLGQHIVQSGEGGNYDMPEVNRYLGLQDHGHSYFANSLIYADHQENIMIYGEGLIDGSCLDEETGLREFVLLGGDPEEPARRSDPGYRRPGGCRQTGSGTEDTPLKEHSDAPSAEVPGDGWFGNKAIALVNCRNVVLADFSLIIGGHFAVIAEGVENLCIDHVLVDTNRDALDLDCCKDVTVTNSVFNSLTDDAVVVKASYGAGRFAPSENILIEDCVVSGYDAGSVYLKTYTTQKLVADDGCGPTGRVKLGTESTCGYDRVTVKRTLFDRSRGFALEAVDGSPLSNVIMEDCTMRHVSSSPFFIRAGNRGRFPVTGNSASDDFPAKEKNVRLDNPNWILPDTDQYDRYPPKSFQPSYNRTKKVCIDGEHAFFIVDDKQPARINAANLVWADRQSAPCATRDEYAFANACGYAHPAKVSHIRIRNVRIEDADPRYPILLMGLVDSPIEDVGIADVKVSFRGGITMEQAVGQPQSFVEHKYRQSGTREQVQRVPVLVNPFFAKHEALLPRADYDAQSACWVDDAYNVPEMPEVYPEPSNWGILPAYGIYARHVRGLTVSNVTITAETPDGRRVIVLDDVQDARLDRVTANVPNGAALVTNHYKRATGREYLPEEPYVTTTVEGVDFKETAVGDICRVEVNAPAPGTPPDSLYGYPTAATPDSGYHCRTGKYEKRKF